VCTKTIILDVTVLIRKAVIPAAGLGTRLLPITKELPKEMLPLFFKGNDENICLKPMLQCIFEQLYDSGFREFCIVGGRGKRAIEDHFTPDTNFLEYLKERNKAKVATGLEEFYEKLKNSTVVFTNQPEPKGFGDAVLKASNFAEAENFVVHAGDDLILSRNNNHIRKLVRIFEELEADAVFFVEKVKDPKRYGVIKGIEISDAIYRVEKIVEKPKIPPSQFAVIAIYAFKPSIFEEIRNLKIDKSSELELTDAIQGMIRRGKKVYALELKNGKRIETGTPKTYWRALSITHKFDSNTEMRF